MTPQPEDDDLDPYEAWARDRLTPLLGPLRWTDRRGGPPGLHDFEADLPNAAIAALEVTSEVDAQRRDLASSAEHHLSSITLPNSGSLWVVALAADARVNAITPEKLRRLLGELEAGGRRNVHNIGDYHDPFVARLRTLGIESIYQVNAKPGSEGMVIVQAGTYGGWGWDGAAIDRWLGEFLASAQGTNKVSKLGRARAASGTLSSCSIPSARQASVSRWACKPAASAAPPTTRCPRSRRRSRSPTYGCFLHSGRPGTASGGRVMVDGRSTSVSGADGLV
jgi:hypothetical protein